MSGEELSRARATLGDLWGLGRPLMAIELGRVLRLGGDDPAHDIRKWETGKSPISGPVRVAIDLMLAGAMPDTWPAAEVHFTRPDMSLVRDVTERFLVQRQEKASIALPPRMMKTLKRHGSLSPAQIGAGEPSARASEDKRPAQTTPSRPSRTPQDAGHPPRRTRLVKH